nr:unnamed protein product [Digitaria exilis]
MENIQKGEQRDLTGEDGSLADAGGADEEDTGPRLQGSLHSLATKALYPTLDQSGKFGDATRDRKKTS